MIPKPRPELRVVDGDTFERPPRDPVVWRPGLSSAREALARSARPEPDPPPPIKLSDRPKLEPAEVLVERALSAWPDVEACRAALGELLDRGEAAGRVALVRAVRSALAELPDPEPVGDPEEVPPDVWPWL